MARNRYEAFLLNGTVIASADDQTWVHLRAEEYRDRHRMVWVGERDNGPTTPVEAPNGATA